MDDKKRILVMARRWFSKAEGNTYHTVRVFVNGQQVGAAPRTYGYGRCFEQTAAGLLLAAGVYKRSPGSNEPILWHMVKRDNGDQLTIDLVDVANKSMLHVANACTD